MPIPMKNPPASIGRPVRAFCFVLVFSLSILSAACSDPESPRDDDTRTQEGSAVRLSDTPISACRLDLLDLAFRTASLVPSRPHVKTRAHLQAFVIKACIDLDQPVKALEWTTRVPNWRRGAAFADLAYYCAERSLPDLALRYSEAAASEIQRMSQDDALQEWRGDRIRSRLAGVHAILGDDEAASKLEDGITPSEAGGAAIARARRPVLDEFRAHRDFLREAVKSMPMDHLRNVLFAHVSYYRAFFESRDVRTEIEEDIRLGSERLPVPIRVELLVRMADSAQEHGDRAEAIRLIDDAAGVVESVSWTAEHRLPRVALVAMARHRAGGSDRARKDVLAALALYELDRHTILDIDRAAVLVPLAEVLAATGDADLAAAVYRRAAGEAVLNPNSRPRAESLVAICLSMAGAGFEPSAELRGQIEGIFAGLGDPW